MTRQLLCLLAMTIALAGCKTKTETIVSQYTPAALAPGVQAIEVEDGTGTVVMRHAFVNTASNQITVYSAQAAGSDATWGTADDAKTVRTTCTFTADLLLDSRVFATIDYGIENLASADYRLCELARQKGSTAFAVQGQYQSDPSTLASTYPSNVSAGDYYAALGGAFTRSSTILNVGWRNCLNACAQTGTGNATATGSDNTSNPSLYSWMIATHDTYSGEALTPYLDNGKVNVVSITTETSSTNFMLLTDFQDAYYQMAYDTNGALARRYYYSGKGADNGWRTGNDDLLRSMMTQETLSDGWRRVYSLVGDAGKGTDNLWADTIDGIERIVEAHFLNGKLSTVKVCTGAGTDATWQTPDDDCRTARFIY